MIWLFLGSLAGAIEPPAEFDRDEIKVWEDRARKVAEGSNTGCWTLSGEVRAQVQLFLPAMPFAPSTTENLIQTGSFEATYDRGTWTRFVMDLRQDGVPVPGDLIVGPALGTLGKGVVQSQTDLADTAAAPPTEDTDTPDGGSASISLSGDGISATTAGVQASSMLAGLVDGAMTDQPTVSYVDWDELRGEVKLVVEASVDADHPNTPMTTEVRFPGGQAVPTSFDTTLGKKLSYNDGPIPIRILAFEVRTRGQVQQGELLPTVERLSGAVGALGFTAGYERVLVFRTAQRCAE